MSESTVKRRQMRYRKSRCGKAWVESGDSDILSYSTASEICRKSDELNDWRAGLAPEPEWHKAKGKR